MLADMYVIKKGKAKLTLPLLPLRKYHITNGDAVYAKLYPAVFSYIATKILAYVLAISLCCYYYIFSNALYPDYAIESSCSNYNLSIASKYSADIEQDLQCYVAITR